MPKINQTTTDSYTVADFIKDFRAEIGDSSCSVPETYIIAYLNKALRRLAREEDIEKLFERKDTFELASINKDGTASVAWDLGNVGKMIEINKLNMYINDDACVRKICPGYKEDIEDCCGGLPEQRNPGIPCCYTIEQIGTLNRLLFDRPPCKLISIDLYYSAFHPRITSRDQEILIPYDFMDVIMDMVIIYHKIETTDMATARALWEDVDAAIADLIEFLNKRNKAVPYRRVNRSF